jgi:MoaA/NifB/PqqE/SkfB family radical SAM enzyme
VTNVLPYTREFKEEVTYYLASGSHRPRNRSRWSPEILLPRMDARPEYLEPLLGLLRHGGTIDPLLGNPDKAYGYCRFVREGAAAVAWDGSVSPCVALMHSYTCYVLGREKAIRRYTVGNVNDEGITRIYEQEEYRRFRDRVVEFDFSPCADCGGCEYAETNEEDCFGNEFPVCGDCLWARGIIQCP